MRPDPTRLCVVTLNVLVHRVRIGDTRDGASEGQNADSGCWEDLIKVSLKTGEDTNHTKGGLYRRLALTIAEVDVKTAVLVGSNAVAFTRESFMNSLDESVDFSL